MSEEEKDKLEKEKQRRILNNPTVKNTAEDLKKSQEHLNKVRRGEE